MRIVTVLLALGLATPSDRPWAEKPQEEWTLEETDAVLWESPWVQYETYTHFVTSHIIREVRCYARLHSARPVRLAMARRVQLEPGPHLRYAGPVDNRKVLELAESLDTPGEISLTVTCTSRGFHHMLEGETLESLRKSTYLLIGKERRKIPLAFYHPPSQTATGDAFFRFPRPNNAEQMKKEIRFVCTFGRRQKVELDFKFKLKDLVFDGRVEY